MDDTALVIAAQNGDREALRKLLAKHQDGIYALIRRIVGNDADAYDATQEALLAVVRGLPGFNRQSRFSTWVYRVASNAAIDQLRRNQRNPAPSANLEDDYANTIARQDAHTPSFYTAVEDRLSIDQALQLISHDFAVAVVLRDQLGFDYAEIGKILEIPIGTVRSRIARGRRELAQILGPLRHRGAEGTNENHPTSN